MVTTEKTALVCPLCEKANNCGANNEKPCWCMNEAFPAELVEQANAQTANQCICLGCLKKFQAASSQ